MIDLNRRIVAMLRDRQQAKTYHDLAKFGVGDRVRFEAAGGDLIDGDVVRVSKKTVTVCTGDHRHWRVSPSLLTKLSGPVAPWEPLPTDHEKGADEDEEPSQAQFETCRDTVNDWWKRFARSGFYHGLSESHQREAQHVITAFGDFMYNYTGYVPAKWTDSALHEVCTEIMPRKIMADESFFLAIAPVLTQFFGFLATKRYQRNALDLAKRVHNLGDEILRAARAKSSWGPGKQLLADAEAEGVDLSDAAAVRKFMQARTDRARTLLGAPQMPVRNEAKIGRNDPCPCGSGKKFKRCCAGKLRVAGTMQ